MAGGKASGERQVAGKAMLKEDEKGLEGRNVRRHFRVEMINSSVRLDMRRLKEEQRNGSFVQFSRREAHPLQVPEKCHQCRASKFPE